MRRNDITPRILAMILSAATLFSTVSTVAYANEDTNTVQEMVEPQAEETTQSETAAEPEVVVQDETAESQPVEPQPEETQPAESQPEVVPTSEPIPEPQPEEPQPTQSEQEETPEVVPATTVEETPETTAESTQETSEQTENSAEPMRPAAEEETTDAFLDSLKSQGKKIAEVIISTSKERVSKLIEGLVGVVPGGDYIKSLFDLLTGALGDEIIGSIWSDTSVSEIDVVIAKLEEIQRDISSIYSKTIELSNLTFKEAINTVHRITGAYINRLIAYNKAVSELKKEPEGSVRTAALEANVATAKASLVALASNPEISQTLRSNLAIAIQYMSNDTVGGKADNPFLINLESKKADPDFKYGADLLVVQREFDETVWRFFAEGLTLYTACMEINASVTEDPTDAQVIAQNLAEILTGSSDGSESYIGNSVINALKIYNEEIRQAENESIGEYREKGKAVAKFKVLTNASISKDGFFTITNGTYNTEAEAYINNFKKTSYEAYLEKLNSMIKTEFLGNPDYESMTLRTFITNKLGVTVPEQSKYLLLSNVRFSYGNYIKVIALDETQTSIESLRLDNSGYDNICIFTESMDSIENRAASVSCSNRSIFNFASFEEAWNFANSNLGVRSRTVTLYQDVTAQKNGDENFTRFAYGQNFTAEENGKTVYGAIMVYGDITIDLNGHTINRNQDIPVAGGSVFILSMGAGLILKNGTVTGGNTTGNGGVVNSFNNKTGVTLENMTLTGNHADGYGGAVYYGNGIDYEIKDTTITNNTAGKNGGGIYCASYGGIDTADIVAKGTIVIWDNTVNGKANNATLTDSGAKKTIFKLRDSFSKNSKIGVNSTTTDKWLDITNGCDLSKDCKDCFNADNENQSLECYKSKVLKNWYICIWNDNKK